MDNEHSHPLVRTLQNYASFIVFCILLLLLTAGALYSLYLGNAIRYWDEEHYLLLARHLHNGIYSFNGSDPTAFQPPGYPFFLFILSFVSSDFFLMRFANFLCLALTIICLYRLLKQEENALAGILAAAMAATYPLFFYTAGTLYPQILASALLVLTLTIMGNRSPSNWKRELNIGLVLGVLGLVTPSLLLFLPAWLIYPWFNGQSDKLRASILLLVGCLAVVGCWTLRNAFTFDRLVLISSNAGVNLLLGNSANTTPESGVNTNLDKFVYIGERMNEFDQNDYYHQEAVAWITENPGKAAKLYVLKVLNYFNFENELASKHEQTFFRDLLSFLSYYPMLVLALCRFILARRYPLQLYEWYLAFILFLSPFLQAIFFTRIRFRIPFDFLMIFFAASSLSLLISQFSRRTDAQVRNRN